MHQRANMRSTNIATEQKQTLYAQRKRCNPDIVFVPIQLLSAGELYYRFPWIYYFSPFSWTRLSLNGELVNGFVYPSFEAKVTGLMFLIVVLTVVLTLINKKQNKYD